MLTMNQWCWSGFVCCFAGPPISLLWLFFNTGSPLALAAIFVPAIARYMILSVGMPILYALGALYIALMVYAGLRGNQMSWNRRSFPSVAAFHRSHQLWLYWGLGSIVVNFLSTYFLILPLIRALIGR